MPICSYLVIPEEGATAFLRRRLAEIRGCEVFEAENRELLLLVTETGGPRQEATLRRTLEAIREIRGLLMTFGEIIPEGAETTSPGTTAGGSGHSDRDPSPRRPPESDGNDPAGSSYR